MKINSGVKIGLAIYVTLYDFAVSQIGHPQSCRIT